MQPGEKHDIAQDYVLGFLFDVHGEQVALVQKNRPAWQAGRLNGVGGKVEPTDADPDEAMRREFREEAGQDITGWILFGTLRVNQASTIYLYYARSQRIYELRSMTDEHVDVYLVQNVMHGADRPPPARPLPNVPWMIQQALSMEEGENCLRFEMQEVP